MAGRPIFVVITLEAVFRDMSRLDSVQPRTRPAACQFCGYEITGNPHWTSGEVFCSERCREAFDSGREPFAGRGGFKYFRTGVPVIDALLPDGIPANSFVLLTGTEGIRHRGLQTELLWRTLTRGEPAIILTFVDPPVAIVEQFLTYGWNVLPYLESGRLQIIDCFTSRLREEHQTPSHQTDWNEFLEGFCDGAVTRVHETDNLVSVEDALHAQLVEMGMVGTGIVVIDSLNEVEIQGHESATEQFIKEVRADVCSRKFVPIFTSVTSSERDPFVRDYRYLFDGIIGMRVNESFGENVRLKQLGVQKMDGVLYRPHWVTYETTGEAGFQVVDPNELLGSTYTISTRTPPADSEPNRW
jgi:KaiC/GvpD/RAD55 family RecA-like ATPase